MNEREKGKAGGGLPSARHSTLLPHTHVIDLELIVTNTTSVK